VAQEREPTTPADYLKAVTRTWPEIKVETLILGPVRHPLHMCLHPRYLLSEVADTTHTHKRPLLS
jgi:hypothetical protein